MDNLITFGCSFTKNIWPTWADYAGCYYMSFINLGHGGSGNRQIFNKIINNIDIVAESDVIIEWSSFIREDRILPLEKLKLFDREYAYTEWIGTGPMHVSNRVVNDNFREYWTPLQTVEESVNYIYATTELLKKLKVNFFSTWMLDPRIGFFLGEPGADISCSKEEKTKIISKLNYLSDYIDKNKKYFASTCITSFSMDQYDEDLWLYSRDEEVMVDRHSSPLAQYRYVQDILRLEMDNVPFYHSSTLEKNSVDWHNFLRDKEAVKKAKGNFNLNFPRLK